MKLSDRLDELVAGERARRPRWSDERRDAVLARIRATRRESETREIRPSSRPGKGVWLTSGALLVAAAIVLLWWVPRDPSSPPDAALTTAPSESALVPSLALADGSKVYFANATHPTRVVGEGRREVRLSQAVGRARYVVAKQPAGRVFVVEAGVVEVVVRGTEFTVNRSRREVSVEVTEGRVEVKSFGKSQTLTRGMRVAIELEQPEAAAGAPTTAPQASSSKESAQPEATTQRPPPSPASNPGTSTESTDPAATQPASLDDLLAQADQARAAGRWEEAATKLERFVSLGKGDPRRVSAWFTLGRVRRVQGRHGQAAQAFETAQRLSPRGTLGAEAQSEAVASWIRAGDRAAARRAASRYLEHYPNGDNSERMKKLVAPVVRARSRE